MTFVSRTLRITDLTLTVVSVLFAIATLGMWLEALQWGGTYAYANALAWTLVTLAVFAAGAVIEWLQDWGE